jgi:hypothetical protein
MIKNDDERDDTQGGGSGQGGGKTGTKGFRVQLEISRDDLLAPNEIKHLLKIHQEYHKTHVDRQKLLRKERAALKEGRKDLVAQYRSQLGLGSGSGGVSPFKKHPISNKAQFSGMDRQTSILPTENTAETNSEMRNDLENRYNHRHQPKPGFNPKPRPM